MSYETESKSNCLELSLRDLGVDESTDYPEYCNGMETLFSKIVMYTPTKQSHLGKKFESYHKINNRTVDSFLQQVFKGLGLNNVYLFKSYSGSGKGKHDLSASIINDTGHFICLRNDNGVKYSLYMSIRNAIAHGNIIKDKNDDYILYSVADDKREFDSNLTLFLRIRGLNKLKALLTVLKLYE